MGGRGSSGKSRSGGGGAGKSTIVTSASELYDAPVG